MPISAPHTWGKYTPDKIFAVVAAASKARDLYGKDQVINAAPGTFLDDNESIYCLPTVEKVYRNLPIHEVIAYSPLEGSPGFLNAAIKHVFRDNMPEAYVKAIATPGGTGALHNLVANYSSVGDTILCSDWSWGPYKSIAEDALRKFDTYELFDGEGFNLSSFENKVSSILDNQERLVVIINTPANNPTGYSLTLDEWDGVLALCDKYAKNNRYIILAVDVAYLDYTFDPQASRTFLSKLGQVSENVLPVVCFSMSKSYTMYGQRVGAMIGISKNEEVVDDFFKVNQVTSRATWSSINRGVSKVLSTINGDAMLVAQVDAERAECLNIIRQRAGIFVEEANQAGLATLPFRSGFFLTIPCAKPQDVCNTLQQQNIFLVPLAKGVRISVCAVPAAKMTGLAQKVKGAIDAIK